MNRLWKRLKLSGLIGMMATAGALAGPMEQELKFPLLKIGTQTLTNATVTTRNKEYIFVLHSGGMTNFKVANLDDETLETLGLNAMIKPKAQTNTVATWAKGTISNMQTERVMALEESVKSRLPTTATISKLDPIFFLAIGACLLLSYFFFCYCSMLICRKAGTEPGVLVWIPILQMIPLIRAAGMGPLWVLAFIIPLLNLVAQVVWSFKIAKARGKNAVWAILLLLPVTNILAFIYLAFSDGGQSSKPEQRRSAPLMTLETA
jgi:hypothetical protein